MSLEHLTEDSSRAVSESLLLRTFVSVALSGMHFATSAVEWITLNRRMAKHLRRPNPYPTEKDFEEQRKEAKKHEDFAKEQASLGFPYLFSVATVRVWSILEVMADDLVRRLLRTPETLPPDGVLLKLEGPLLPFINASPDERADLMATTLKQKLSTALKPGAARIEELLSPFGLAGAIDESIRRLLIELWAIRNILVHRSGTTDKRFIDACPWLGCVDGAPLTLTYNHFNLYSFAVDWYALEVELRVVRKFKLAGIGKAEDYVETQQALLSAIRRISQDRPTGELTRVRDSPESESSINQVKLTPVRPTNDETDRSK